MTSGIYVIEGIGRKRYVGESGHIEKRDTVVLSRRLGLHVYIAREMPGSTRIERQKAEDALMDTLEAAGFEIVSFTGNGVVGSSHTYRVQAGRAGGHRRYRS